MSYIGDKIMQLTRQLYPTGRAWKLPFGGFFEALHLGLAKSEERAINDAVSTMDSLMPDNANFTLLDTIDKERIYGLIGNASTSTALRNAAIIRKMKSPGRNPAKAHYLYLEYQLQLAGFPVYVYENLIPLYPTGYTYYNPAALNPAILSQSQHGDKQHGDAQSAYLNHMIVNSLDNNQDVNFNVGNSLAATFFIGGAPLGTYVNLPAAREQEFRQLVLQLKQVQAVAILFINFV